MEGKNHNFLCFIQNVVYDLRTCFEFWLAGQIKQIPENLFKWLLKSWQRLVYRLSQKRIVCILEVSTKHLLKKRSFWVLNFPRNDKRSNQLLNLHYHFDISLNLVFTEEILWQLLVHWLTLRHTWEPFFEQLFELSKVASMTEVNTFEWLPRIAVAVTKLIKLRYQIWSDHFCKRVEVHRFLHDVNCWQQNYTFHTANNLDELFLLGPKSVHVEETITYTSLLNHLSLIDNTDSQLKGAKFWEHLVRYVESNNQNTSVGAYLLPFIY